MKTMYLFGALSLSLLSAPVLAEDAAPAPATVKKLNPRDPNAVRCRKIDVIGSLVKKERICKTNAQWSSISDSQNREADDLISRSRSGTNQGL